MRGERFPLPAEIAHQVTRVLRLQRRRAAGAARRVRRGGHRSPRRRRMRGRVAHAGGRRAGAIGWPSGRPCCGAITWSRSSATARRSASPRSGCSSSERCVAREISPRQPGAAAGRGPRGGGAIGARHGAAGRRAGAVSRRAGATIGPAVRAADGPRLGSLTPPASLVIGPEGGFSPDEVAAAEQSGVTVAGLGPRILRSETVALAAAAVVLSRSGDFA